MTKGERAGEVVDIDAEEFGLYMSLELDGDTEGEAEEEIVPEGESREEGVMSISRFCV